MDFLCYISSQTVQEYYMRLEYQSNASQTSEIILFSCRRLYNQEIISQLKFNKNKYTYSNISSNFMNLYTWHHNVVKGCINILLQFVGFSPWKLETHNVNFDSVIMLALKKSLLCKITC